MDQHENENICGVLSTHTYINTMKQIWKFTENLSEENLIYFALLSFMKSFRQISFITVVLLEVQIQL